jgi:ferredoxin-NADP reductase
VSSQLHDRVGVGTRLRAKAPTGGFHLQAEAGVPLVLIGAGIGVTPLLSILETVLREEPTREVSLFYGVRNGAEHIRKAQLEALAMAHPGFQLHVCYSAPTAADRSGIDYRHAGRIDLGLLRNTLKPARHAFYVCGPAPMMASLVPALGDWGVPAADIHYEAFGPSTVQPPRAPHRESLSLAGSTAVAITFRESGRTLPWRAGAGSLLAFAEEHGIVVESGCRSGSCGGCQTRLEQGEVSYIAEPLADVTDGHCLLCVSVPQGPITLGA